MKNKKEKEEARLREKLDEQLFDDLPRKSKKDWAKAEKWFRDKVSIKNQCYRGDSTLDD